MDGKDKTLIRVALALLAHQIENDGQISVGALFAAYELAEIKPSGDGPTPNPLHGVTPQYIKELAGRV